MQVVAIIAYFNVIVQREADVAEEDPGRWMLDPGECYVCGERVLVPPDYNDYLPCEARPLCEQCCDAGPHQPVTITALVPARCAELADFDTLLLSERN